MKKTIKTFFWFLFVVFLFVIESSFVNTSKHIRGAVMGDQDNYADYFARENRHAAVSHHNVWTTRKNTKEEVKNATVDESPRSPFSDSAEHVHKRLAQLPDPVFFISPAQRYNIKRDQEINQANDERVEAILLQKRRNSQKAAWRKRKGPSSKPKPKGSSSSRRK